MRGLRGLDPAVVLRLAGLRQLRRLRSAWHALRRVAGRLRAALGAILNLGAGGAAFIGPAIATALNPFVGYSGVVIAYSALYFICAVLTTFIRDASDPGEEGEPEEEAVATA